MQLHQVPPSRRASSARPTGRFRAAASAGALVLSLLLGPALSRALDAGSPSAEANAHVVENLYGAKLLDADHGYTVGAFGAVFRTSDGGRTWQALEAATREYLFSVDFDSP